MQNHQNPWMPYVLALILASYAIFFVNSLPLSGPPDELAHLSYINDAANSSWWLPDYKNGVILNSTKLNFLSHPPLYYTLQAVVGQVLGWDPSIDFISYRYVSVLMVALGMLLVLKAAQNYGLSNFALVTLAMAALCVPNFVYIASSINNDNLAFLAVAVLFYGLTGLEAGQHQNKKSFIWFIGISLLFIGLGKVNVALFTAVFLFIWLVLTKGKFLRNTLSDRSWIVVLVACAIVLTYYVLTYVEYGRLFPSPRYVYELQTPEQPLTFRAYTEQFFALLLTRFTGAYGHLSYLVYPSALTNLYYLMLLGPVGIYGVLRMSTVFLRAKYENLYLFDALFVAASVVLLMHLKLGYEGYLATGRMAAIQPRYYLFLIPIVWIPFYVISRELKIFNQLKLLFPALVFFLLPVAGAYSAAGVSKALSNSKNLTLDADSFDGRSIFSGHVPLMNGTFGYVDLLELKGDRIHVVGWAFDHKNNTGPKYITLYKQKLLVGQFGPNAVRPDVARYMKSLRAASSGFRISLSVGASDQACQFDVLAEFPNGMFSLIHPSTC